MTDLSYPFVFECTGCGTEATVGRGDAGGLSPDPDSIGSVLMVLDKRGWLRDEDEGLLLCPACTED